MVMGRGDVVATDRRCRGPAAAATVDVCGAASDWCRRSLRRWFDVWRSDAVPSTSALAVLRRRVLSGRRGRRRVCGAAPSGAGPRALPPSSSPSVPGEPSPAPATVGPTRGDGTGSAGASCAAVAWRRGFSSTPASSGTTAPASSGGRGWGWGSGENASEPYVSVSTGLGEPSSQ